MFFFPNITRRGIFIIPVFLLSLFAVPSFVHAEVSLNAGVESFTWREYANGAKLLEESGNRPFFAFRFLQDGDGGALFGYQGRVYGGDVAYTGQTQSGIPVGTTTGYSGMLNEFDLHYRFSPSANYHLDAVGGLGVDFWRRDIRGTFIAAIGSFAAGYTEEYVIGFARLGLETSHKGHGIVARAGAKLPVSTWEKANLQSALGADSDPVLEPGKAVSYYASVGYRFAAPFIIQAEYEGYRFSESPKVPLTIGGTAARVYQPESWQDQILFSVGYVFNGNGAEKKE